MLNQRDGLNPIRIRLLQITFKSRKISYFIPIAVMFLIVPFMIYSDVLRFGIDAVTPQSKVQMLVPIFSVWWVFVSLKEYVEGEGVELLYACLSKDKTKLIDVLVLCVWYGLHVVLLHCILSVWFQGMFWLCIVILIQSLFFMMSYYALMMIMKTTSISLMVILIYYFMCMFFSVNTIFEILTIFSDEPADLYFIQTHCSIVGTISILFGVIGYLLNRHYHRLLRD